MGFIETQQQIDSLHSISNLTCRRNIRLDSPVSFTVQFFRMFHELTSDIPRDMETEPLLHLLDERFKSTRPNTNAHTHRVDDLALRLSNAYNETVDPDIRLTDAELFNLHWAGRFHDIGKMAIPIWLLKKRIYTPTELDFATLHPYFSALILSQFPILDKITEYVLLHHENRDGSGLIGIKEEHIPLAVQIIKVADMFDARTSKRPGDPAKPPAEAYDFLRQQQTTINQTIVELLPKCFDGFLC